MFGRRKRSAFTLTELLVVVIVLGVLAAVALPKFSRVLETRRTTEAEHVLAAVRTEQEKRCVLGQNYTGDFSNIPSVAYAKTADGRAQSGSYTYTLTETGVSANREGKDYLLKIPSYKNGEICCEGDGCEDLNKSYPSCDEITVSVDECAATDVVADDPKPTDECDLDPSSCECNPNQEACCAAGETWDGSACVAEESCQESYGAASLSTDTTDTCDGDSLNAYTCDGHFNGTCTDSYIRTLNSGGVTILASYTEDPFLNFKESVWLAQTLTYCDPECLESGGSCTEDGGCIYSEAVEDLPRVELDDPDIVFDNELTGQVIIKDEDDDDGISLSDPIQLNIYSR